MVTTATDCELFLATDEDSAAAASFLTSASLFITAIQRFNIDPNEPGSRWRLHIRVGNMLCQTLPEGAIPDRLSHVIPALVRLAERFFWAERVLAPEYLMPVADRQFPLSSDARDQVRTEMDLGDAMGFVARQLQSRPPYVPKQPLESVALLIEQGVYEEQVSLIWGLSRCDVRREMDNPGSVVTGPDFVAPSCQARVEEQKQIEKKAAAELLKFAMRINGFGHDYSG
jgi:hypothetical protein